MHRKTSPVVAPACPSLCSPCSGLDCIVKASSLVVVSFYFFISPSLKILKRESCKQQYSHLQWVLFNFPPQNIKLMTFQRTIRRPKATPTINTHNYQAQPRVPAKAATRQTPIRIISKVSFLAGKATYTHNLKW